LLRRGLWVFGREGLSQNCILDLCGAYHFDGDNGLTMDERPWWKETKLDQVVAQVTGCFICGAKPVHYTVKDKGYCQEHRQYAVDARKRINIRVDQSVYSYESTLKEIERRLKRKDSALSLKHSHRRKK
jgi:hypothetical protein